jgi:hypothetical protein
MNVCFIFYRERGKEKTRVMMQIHFSLCFMSETIHHWSLGLPLFSHLAVLQMVSTLDDI